jgi:vacuolar-type H+-ATPase catalytic subunit A/Vma1
VDFWISEVIDAALIQQDAFDPIDRFASVDRQEYGLEMPCKADLRACPMTFDVVRGGGAVLQEK